MRIEPQLWEDMKTAFRLGGLTSSMLLPMTVFAVGDASSPACKAAEALSGIWGLVKVVITGVVVLGLLGGAAASFMERRGGWGMGLIFASFILGAILWTSLTAIGEQIDNFKNSSSCTGA